MTEPASADLVTLTFGGAELVDALEPLWLTLFDHHRTVGPGPFIDREDSWAAFSRTRAPRTPMPTLARPAINGLKRWRVTQPGRR